MRLNIGCGAFKAEGWYNLDIWPGCEPDMVADAVTVNIPAGSVESVYLGHVLEHVARPDLDKIMYNVWRMLVPGGWVCAVGPDMDRVNKIADPELWKMLAEGGNDERSDDFITHKWECTERQLLDVLRTWFPAAQPIDIGRVRPDFPLVSLVHWQCAVMARKPAW